MIDDLGRLAIDHDTARTLITEHQARVAASAAAQRDRDQAHRANIAAQLDSTHERVRAIQASQTARRAQGLWDDSMSAVEAMVSGDKQADLDGIPSWRMDAWLRGESYGGRFTPEMSKEQ